MGGFNYSEILIAAGLQDSTESKPKQSGGFDYDTILQIAKTGEIPQPEYEGPSIADTLPEQPPIGDFKPEFATVESVSLAQQDPETLLHQEIDNVIDGKDSFGQEAQIEQKEKPGFFKQSWDDYNQNKDIWKTKFQEIKQDPEKFKELEEHVKKKFDGIPWKYISQGLLSSFPGGGWINKATGLDYYEPTPIEWEYLKSVDRLIKGVEIPGSDGVWLGLRDIRGLSNIIGQFKGVGMASAALLSKFGKGQKLLKGFNSSKKMRKIGSHVGKSIIDFNLHNMIEPIPDVDFSEDAAFTNSLLARIKGMPRATRDALIFGFFGSAQKGISQYGGLFVAGASTAYLETGNIGEAVKSGTLLTGMHFFNTSGRGAFEKWGKQNKISDKIINDTVEFLDKSGFEEKQAPQEIKPEIRNKAVEKNRSRVTSAKQRKSNVEVPETGKAEGPTSENILKRGLPAVIEPEKPVEKVTPAAVEKPSKPILLRPSLTIERMEGRLEAIDRMIDLGVATGAAKEILMSERKIITEQIESIKTKKPQRIQSKEEVTVEPIKSSFLETVKLDPKDVSFDEATFQPKTSYRQAIVDKIVNKFDAKEWEEPVLWKDPETDKLIILRGHHRQKGALGARKKGLVDTLPYKVLPEGTTRAEAIRFAKSESRDVPTDLENAKTIRERFEAGESMMDIAKDMVQVAPRSKTIETRRYAIHDIMNLAYLDQNGMFVGVYDKTTDFSKIMSLSKWVGGLRKKYDWLSNTHEKDLFQFFYTERGVAHRIDIDAVKKQIAEGMMSIEESGEVPARLGWLHKGLVTGIEAIDPVNAKRLKSLRGSLAGLDVLIHDKNITIERQRELTLERATLQKEYDKMLVELGKAEQNQESLFSVKMDQENVFGGTDKVSVKSRKVEKIEEESRQRQLQLNREKEFIQQQAKLGNITETTRDELRKLVNAQKRYEKEVKGQQSMLGGDKSQEQKPLFVEKSSRVNEPTKSKYPERAKREGGQVLMTKPSKGQRSADLSDLAFDSDGNILEKSGTTQVGTGKFKHSDLQKTTTLRDIGLNLIQSLDKTPGRQVRFGLVKRFKRRALGIFFPRSGIIRIRNINDIKTLSHEIGHEMDIHIFQFSDKFRYNKADKIEKIVVMAKGKKNAEVREKILNKYRDRFGVEIVDGILERAELRQELYGMLKSYGYPQVNPEEGVAEFVKWYVTKPEYAQKVAPKFHGLFERILVENPQLHDALIGARRQFKQYNAQDPRQKIHSTVAREKKTGFMEGIVSFKDNLFYNIVDMSEPWRKLERELRKKNPKLPGKDNPLLSFLSIIGVDGKAQQFFTHPFLLKGNDIEIRKDIKGLLKIIKNPHKKGVLDGYEDYLVAKRNLELIANKKSYAATQPKKISEQAVKLFEEQYGKKNLEQFAKDIYEYQNALLDYYADSGKLSRDQLKKIRELNNYYIPFKRYFAEYETQGRKFNFSRFIKENSSQKVKGIKGSLREVTSPIESILKNTYDLIADADINRAKIVMLNGMRSIDPTSVQSIPKRIVKPTTVIKDGEITIELSITAEKPYGREIISIHRQGKIEYWEIPKDYYDSLFAINEPLNKTIEILSIPTRWIHAGAVVYDPTFGIRNVFRDQVSAMFYSKYGYMPTDFAKGIWAWIKNDNAYQKFLASGADQSFLTALDQMLSRGYIEGKTDKNFQGGVRKYLRNPLLLFQKFNRATELGTRIGAFKKAYAKTGDPWLAMQEGREISADYGIRGKAMKHISPLYAFLNARLQHVKKTGEVLKSRKKEMLWKGLAYVTAPSILNWIANNNNEERRELYQELPGWRKLGFWNVAIPGTRSFMMIPKGFFGTMFGTGSEATLDWILNNDPELLKQLPQGLFDELTPLNSSVETIPTIFRPFTEHFANKKGYTRSPIVSKRFEGLEKSEQYNSRTPQILRIFGKIAGISPLVFENYIRGYFGGGGIGAVNIVDEILEGIGLLESKPGDTFTKLARLPFVRAFFIEPYIGTRGESVNKFYNKLDELVKINRQVNDYIDKNKTNELASYLEDKNRNADYKWYAENQTEIERFKNVLWAIRGMVQEIWKDKNNDNKREEIEKLQMAVTETAKAFQKAYKDNKSFDMLLAMQRISINLKFEKSKKSLERKIVKSQW